MIKTGMLIATCCLSLLAMPLSTMACDKDKAAGCQGEKTVLTVVSTDGSSSCSQSKAKQLVEAARNQAACNQTAANVRTAAASDCSAEGSKQQIVSTLMRSLDGGCGAKCASKTDVVSALRTIASFEKGLVCEKTLAKHMANANVRTAGQGDACSQACAEACSKECAERCRASNAQVVTIGSGASSCSSAKNAQVVAAGSGSSCSSAKNAQLAKTGSGSSCSSAKNAQLVKAGSGSACSGTKDAAVVANVQTAGSSACSTASAKYVAYGCDKSDRIARAAARAYLQVVRELKLVGEAEGCSNDAASKVLAAVLADMKAEGTTEIAVNFGAMSDAPKSCGSQR